jgi:hypothetical protein
MSHHAARHSDGCRECGLPLCSEKCWSCHGAASSWDYLCEECGGRGQLLLCPRRAHHSPPLPSQRAAERSYWIGGANQQPILLQGLSRASLPARTILQHQLQQSRSYAAILV